MKNLLSLILLFSSAVCFGQGQPSTDSTPQTLANKTLVSPVINGANLSGATIFADQMPGGDMSVKISYALVALGAFSTASGEVQFNGTGTETQSVNWWGVGTPGVNYPQTGTVKICGVQYINQLVPLVNNSGMNFTSCAHGFGTSSPQFIAQSGVFQPTYSTGTVSVGTTGYHEVITSSGATFTTNGTMLGCRFISTGGSGQAWGNIVATTATTLTLGFGSGGGSGASGSYTITCPQYLAGDGGTGSSTPWQYTGEVSRLTFNCNNIAGCIGYQNSYSEEGTVAHDLLIIGFTNIGVDLESNWAQNSGPYYNLDIFPGSACTAGTLAVVSRMGIVGSKPFRDSTLSGVLCSTQVTTLIDANTSGSRWENLHLEDAVNGIAVSIGTACPVACAQGDSQVQGIMIENINAAVSGTNVVNIGTTGGQTNAAVIHDITRDSGWTNVLHDSYNSCTDNTQRLGTYETGSTAAQITNSSSSVAGCLMSYLTVTGGITASNFYGSVALAATATALASAPSLCTTGQAPTGILASGNATGCAAFGAGTVTSFSIVGANGYAGTVATSTTTPALTVTGPKMAYGQLLGAGGGCPLATGSASVPYNYGIASCSRTSAGIYVVTFTSSYFTDTPLCTGKSANGSDVLFFIGAVSASSVTVGAQQSGNYAYTDGYFNLHCIAPI
jgi:hypothetical protein